MSDRIAIFNNVGTSSNVVNQYFMASWRILINGNLLTVYLIFKNVACSILLFTVLF